jgi:hypothetical protein
VTTGKVLKERRAPRERGRTGSSLTSSAASAAASRSADRARQTGSNGALAGAPRATLYAAAMSSRVRATAGNFGRAAAS